MSEESAARARRVKNLKDAGVFSSATSVMRQQRSLAKEKSRMTGAGPGDGHSDGSDISPEAVELGKAMDVHKRETGHAFPSWSEVLDVLKKLGYRKQCPP